MSAADISGLWILCAATLIAVAELLMSAWAPRYQPSADDPCRERPSALPAWRTEDYS